MTDLVRCPICKGRKNIRSMGFTAKKCEECKGIGFIEHVEDEIEYLSEKTHDVFPDPNAEVKTKKVMKKKMGRPKKDAA